MACRPRAGGLAEGFDKADARNLPRVDIMMIVDFFQQDRHPAMKQSKMQRLVIVVTLMHPVEGSRGWACGSQPSMLLSHCFHEAARSETFCQVWANLRADIC